MSYLWRKPHAMKGDRLETVTGPLKHTPLVQAVRESLKDLDLPVAAEPRHPYAMPSMAS